MNKEELKNKYNLTDGQQDIYWKDSLPYGSDYIIDLIENGQF